MDLTPSNWIWLAMSFTVKLLFVFAAWIVKRSEFNFASESAWKEAQSMAAVAAVRGVAATLPPVLLFALLDQTARFCQQRPDALVVLALVLATALLVGWALRLSHGWLRLLPVQLLLVAACTLFELLVMAKGIEPAARLACCVRVHGGGATEITAGFGSCWAPAPGR